MSEEPEGLREYLSYFFCHHSLSTASTLKWTYKDDVLQEEQGTTTIIINITNYYLEERYLNPPPRKGDPQSSIEALLTVEVWLACSSCGCVSWDNWIAGPTFFTPWFVWPRELSSVV